MLFPKSRNIDCPNTRISRFEQIINRFLDEDSDEYDEDEIISKFSGIEGSNYGHRNRLAILSPYIVSKHLKIELSDNGLVALGLYALGLWYPSRFEMESPESLELLSKTEYVMAYLDPGLHLEGIRLRGATDENMRSHNYLEKIGDIFPREQLIKMALENPEERDPVELDKEIDELTQGITKENIASRSLRAREVMREATKHAPESSLLEIARKLTEARLLAGDLALIIIIDSDKLLREIAKILKSSLQSTLHLYPQQVEKITDLLLQKLAVTVNSKEEFVEAFKSLQIDSYRPIFKLIEKSLEKRFHGKDEDEEDGKEIDKFDLYRYIPHPDNTTKKMETPTSLEGQGCAEAAIQSRDHQLEPDTRTVLQTALLADGYLEQKQIDALYEYMTQGTDAQGVNLLPKLGAVQSVQTLLKAEYIHDLLQYIQSLSENDPLQNDLSQVPTGLARGDFGEQVEKLQKALATLGYFKATANGTFGPRTEEALIEFQLQNGIIKDRTSKGAGIFGPKTKAALTHNQNADDRIDPLQNDLSQVPTGLARGAFGEQVKKLQKALATLGYFGEQVKKLQKTLAKLGYFKATADGNFGPKTEKALIEFQLQNGIIKDKTSKGAGIFGPKTKASLSQLINNQNADDTMPRIKLIQSLLSTPLSTPETEPTILHALISETDIYKPETGSKTERSLKAIRMLIQAASISHSTATAAITQCMLGAELLTGDLALRILIHHGHNLEKVANALMGTSKLFGEFKIDDQGKRALMGLLLKKLAITAHSKKDFLGIAGIYEETIRETDMEPINEADLLSRLPHGQLLSAVLEEKFSTKSIQPEQQQPFGIEGVQEETRGKAKQFWQWIKGQFTPNN